MRYQAVNKYDHTDNCGHLHKSEAAAQKCCDKNYAFNVGDVKWIYSPEESKAVMDAVEAEERRGL
jgi:hypothetical protein